MAAGTAPTRLRKEIADLLKAPPAGISEINANEDNILHWKGTVQPAIPPYNKGSFDFVVIFPEQYPFKPPQIKFVTPIYHVNVDEKENSICLGILLETAWKPALKMAEVLRQLVELVSTPDPSHPVRADLGELFVKDRATYDKRVDDHIKKHAARK
eukprot:m.232544 g.232544  ORF g.232544 m.232544 type:complete len:156 (+) comp18766_c0_seq1:192-659(+)